MSDMILLLGFSSLAPNDMTVPRDQITQILAQMGRPGSAREEHAERLYDCIYPDLHQIARRLMGSERDEHTLQPTALIHEAFLRLVDQRNTDWKSRNHFLAISARVMRRVLLDHARGRDRVRRGSGWRRVTLHDEIAEASSFEADHIALLALDQALVDLGEEHPRMASVAEMRLFAGMSPDEMASALDVSKRTVESDWSFARRWLSRALDDSTDRGADE